MRAQCGRCASDRKRSYSLVRCLQEGVESEGRTLSALRQPKPRQRAAWSGVGAPAGPPNQCCPEEEESSEAEVSSTADNGRTTEQRADHLDCFITLRLFCSFSPLPLVPPTLPPALAPYPPPSNTLQYHVPCPCPSQGPISAGSTSNGYQRVQGPDRDMVSGLDGVEIRKESLAEWERRIHLCLVACRCH